MSSRRLTSITRQSGAPSDDLVQTNPMPAASRMERALTSADAVVTGPSCGFGRARPKKQDAVAGAAMVAMAAAPTLARAAYIARSLAGSTVAGALTCGSEAALLLRCRAVSGLLWCGCLFRIAQFFYEQCRSDTINATY